MKDGQELVNLICGLPILVYAGWYIFDLSRLMRASGPLKRGIPVWQEELPDDVSRFISGLHNNIIERHSFILIGPEAALVYAMPKHFGTSWPYVAYIDLTNVTPTIQYRVSLPSLIFLIPFVVTIVAIPFVFPLMLVNHLILRKAILDFVSKCMHNS
jgi:hypothetical protein